LWLALGSVTSRDLRFTGPHTLAAGRTDAGDPDPSRVHGRSYRTTFLGSCQAGIR
jgi:hypothetical protein